LVFREVTDRKARARELILGERPEEIRLILAGIDALAEQEAPAGLVTSDARVVSCRHSHRVPRTRSHEQRSELHVSIARDARDRGATDAVVSDEAIDDHAVELVRGVQEVIRDLERSRDVPRVRSGFGRAAASESIAGL